MHVLKAKVCCFNPSFFLKSTCDITHLDTLITWKKKKKKEQPKQIYEYAWIPSLSNIKQNKRTPRAGMFFRVAKDKVCRISEERPAESLFYVHYLWARVSFTSYAPWSDIFSRFR